MWLYSVWTNSAVCLRFFLIVIKSVGILFMKHRTPWQYEIEAINGVHTSMCNNLLSITNGQNQLYIMYYDVHSILRLIRYMPSNTNTVSPKSMRRFHLHLIDYVPRANMKIHTCCTVHSVHFQHRIRESDNDTCERESEKSSATSLYDTVYNAGKFMLAI